MVEIFRMIEGAIVTDVRTEVDDICITMRKDNKQYELNIHPKAGLMVCEDSIVAEAGLTANLTEETKLIAQYP
jgi:hypothetical protein